jgi:chromosome partitioning protein
VASLVEEIQAGRAEPFAAYSFLSRADIKSADNREVSQALQDYPQLTFLPYPVCNRKAFANSASKGLAVFEMEEPDRKAVAEIDQLFKQIMYGNVATTAAQTEAV